MSKTKITKRSRPSAEAAMDALRTVISAESAARKHSQRKHSQTWRIFDNLSMDDEKKKKQYLKELLARARSAHKTKSAQILSDLIGNR